MAAQSDRLLQQIAAYCSFWEGSPCRLAARDAIENELLTTDNRQLRTGGIMAVTGGP